MSNESTDTTTAPAAVTSAPRHDTSAAVSHRPPELRLALLTRRRQRGMSCISTPV